ncbi:DUF4012 domain-containing protein [Lacisediminihabitans changchengi]|uniref:DUF4012 domain-containing protein n=1 Tax=Lacisediminihabitans changchengi TaxID=2787634 RepID=A0A934SIY3_9MICO|nr:DUF4012 domain-containing protein [Lacisediminihabitans changchengi]MBK4346453.1 DUF4012 domain-containing protein [Lacisediminihabitans changchengi]MBK4348919.1 DUF4012 domain-containing protein [Lacisediminihabitans changchengi]
MAAVLIVGVGVGAWVGVRALSAKKSLESAQSLIADLQTKVTARDFAGAKDDAGKIKKDTANAVSMTSDPIWRVVELVPVLGQNLTVVRQLAGAVNDVAVGAIDPAVDFASTFNLDALKPVDGHINLEPLAKAGTIITSADKVVGAASSTVDSINDSTSISVVKNAVVKLDRLLVKAKGITGPARNALELLPRMMGAGGPRTYIMLFQNNAEAASLGGAASAWTILNVDNGSITLGAQPATESFPRNLPIPIPLDPTVVDLFSQNGLQFSNNVTLRPNFPTAAKLAQAFWLRESGQKVDGVLSFDPVALSYLLTATGPLKLPSGESLTSTTAVPILLSEVYAKYSGVKVQNAFFASAAASVFGALTSSAPDTNKLIAALTRSVSENRLMVWSDHLKEQKVLSSIQLGGIMDTTNKVNTQIGVFFNDNSASKMSYYLNTSAALTSTACQSPGNPTFTAVVVLNSNITEAAQKALPSYVRSQVYLKPVKTRTQVYVYGPPGATNASFSDGGGALAMNLVGSTRDLGRPVAHIQVDLLASQTATFTVTFAGTKGDYGPLSARVTPMVNPTAVTLSSPGCQPSTK